MAQTYNFDGTNLVIPGSYIKTTVLNGNAGLATAGVIALVGEADSGPAYDELKVSKVNGASILVDGSGNRVAFTPDEFSLVQGMFGGGRLVEAFNALAKPFKDGGVNAIAGTPALVYVIKTNQDGAAKAYYDFEDNGSDLVAKFEAKSAGFYGNQIALGIVTGVADTTTGLIPFTVTTDYGTAGSESHTFNDVAAIKLYLKISVADKTATVTDKSLTIDSVEYVFAKYKTVSDLVADINKSATIGAAVASNTLRFESPVGLLDIGAYSSVNMTGQYIGVSGWQLKNTSFAVVNTVDVARNKPVLTASHTYANVTSDKLADGALGSTQDDDVVGALKVLEKVNLNFVVPLFSQNASADILAGETGDDSTYTLHKVIENTLDHVGRMSAVKLKKNRQAFLSHEGTYADVRSILNDGTILLNTPSQFRGSMAFQGVKVLDSTGSAKDFQPWMLANLTASAQAVAGYRPVFNKGLNVLGFTDPTDYEGDIPAQEDALKSGLLVLADSSNGIDTVLLSDQTTYLLPDNNFVYNSIQAVYGADIIALTIQQQMQTFVGQSAGDVSAPIAASFLQSVMANLLNQRWIAASADAPKGYKNLKLNISVPVMSVSIEAKESTGIYFVPINLSISGVTSAA